MRRCAFAFSLLVVLSAFGDTITIADDARGYVNPGGPGGAGDPPHDDGTGATNNYFAGVANVALCIPCTTYFQFRDWFEFSIPSFSGGLTSAAISFDQPGGASPGHIGPATTYTLYGMSGLPQAFSDMGAGLEYATVSLDSTSDGTTVNISLDAAALAAIATDQGGAFFLGGVDSGEDSSTASGDFSSTAGTPVILTLQTASAPEPSTQAICLAAAVLGWAVCARTRRRRLASL